MEKPTHCPSCSTEIGKKATLFPPDAVELINKYVGGTGQGYCTKCSKDKYLKGLEKLNAEKEVFNEYFKRKIWNVPAITIDSPLKWDYDALGVVSGQVTVGMGLMGDLSSTFANLSGGQSNTYNDKLKNAENICLNQMRLKSLYLGGNAVIGVDIDYSEVGGGKGLLMVAATGTAIKLKNTEILGEHLKRDVDEVSKKGEELLPLLKYVTYNVN